MACGTGVVGEQVRQAGYTQVGRKSQKTGSLTFMEVVENRFLIPTRWTAWTPPRPTWRAPWTEAFSGVLPVYP